MKTQSSNLRTAEQSRETQPTFLYFFTYAGASYYFTNYDQDISITGGSAKFGADPRTFSSGQIDHEPPEEDTEPGAKPIPVSIAATDIQLQRYFLTAPSQQIDLEIYRVNSSLLPGPIAFADCYMDFKGVAQSVSFAGYVIQATFLPPILQEDRQVPNFYYQKLCNHDLYGRFCKVNRSLYQLQTTIAAVSRISKTIEIANTSFNVDNPPRSVTINTETFMGGTLDDGFGNIVGIQACEPGVGAGTRLWLNWWPGTLLVAGSIIIEPGCPGIMRICRDFYKNLPNFGGTPFIPVTNPATSSIVT